MRFFELSVAFKYLIPKKKQLSVSLIALMSVGVISLVVWLLLVFLSVTEGMERNWLYKLTALNAPIRITPKEKYFSSYYYQIDSISADSGYSHKSLGEKAAAPVSNPYHPAIDVEVPRFWPAPDRNPDGSLKDPVKLAYQVLEKTPGITYQDYEIGGSLLKLQMRRPEGGLTAGKASELLSVMTQASYLATLSHQNPHLAGLLSPPSEHDLNTLFYLAIRSENPQEQLRLLCEYTQISELKTLPGSFHLPSSFLSEGKSFSAEDRLGKIVLTEKKGKKGQVIKRQGRLFFLSSQGEERGLSPNDCLFLEKPLLFKAERLPSSTQALRDIRFRVSAYLQNEALTGELPWEGLEIASATAITHFEEAPSPPPPWVYQVKQRLVLPKNGILLAKHFRENGARIGDQGHLSYAAVGSSSVQEQRSPIYVAGFYDPGVLSIGTKCIFANPHLVSGAQQAASSIDKTQSTGIQIWFDDLKKAPAIKQQLSQAFASLGIDSYWNVTTFHEYDFAKDMLEQFQSDKTLFTLLGIIILAIACCNIISLLVLLVNDKKKEIGILQAMGATRAQIASIFGSCGILLGVVSSFIGIGLALLTLKNLHPIIRCLNFLQGHEMFNPSFYGATLPNLLSHEALVFVLIATPLVSLLAGLIPAIKASRLNPSAILRSE